MERLKREVKIVETYKNMLQIIEDFRSTDKALEFIKRNIAFNSTYFDLDKFVTVFATQQYVRSVVKELDKELGSMESDIGILDGVDEKVVYRRDVEHKSLKMIASELGYSLGYIRNISSRNPRKKKM